MQLSWSPSVCCSSFAMKQQYSETMSSQNWSIRIPKSRLPCRRLFRVRWKKTLQVWVLRSSFLALQSLTRLRSTCLRLQKSKVSLKSLETGTLSLECKTCLMLSLMWATCLTVGSPKIAPTLALKAPSRRTVSWAGSSNSTSSTSPPTSRAS